MPPCAIECVSRFGADVRALPNDERREIEDILLRLAKTFGQPHLHGGLGIRRLKRDYFECRVGRDLRVMFKLAGNVLIMTRLGNHEEVRNFIKNV
jgi:mRNA-degrading endonuclease YafQ of YafQ-DinJ toxin-antitoxin module